jgi:hypothetical protein
MTRGMTDLMLRYDTRSMEYLDFCPTFKMSHDLRWRGSCSIKIWIVLFHFDQSFESTSRDSHGRWLWRLVRLLGFRK